jgi:hypothetical protein
VLNSHSVPFDSPSASASDSASSAVMTSRAAARAVQLKSIIKGLNLPSLYIADAVTLEANSRDFVSRCKLVNSTGKALADWLEVHPSVKALHYSTGEEYESVMRLVPGTDRMSEDAGYGCLMSIVPADSIDEKAFYDALEVAKGPSLGTNFTIACPYTLLAHYTELPWAAGFGVDSRLIRVSVGMEDIEVRTCTLRYLLSATADPSCPIIIVDSLHCLSPITSTLLCSTASTCVAYLYLIRCCCCSLFSSNCIPHSLLHSSLITSDSPRFTHPLLSSPFLFILHSSLFSLPLSTLIHLLPPSLYTHPSSPSLSLHSSLFYLPLHSLIHLPPSLIYLLPPSLFTHSPSLSLHSSLFYLPLHSLIHLLPLTHNSSPSFSLHSPRSILKGFSRGRWQRLCLKYPSLPSYNIAARSTQRTVAQHSTVQHTVAQHSTLYGTAHITVQQTLQLDAAQHTAYCSTVLYYTVLYYTA